jgi:glyoxylase-like metal-dependent hydrolase (beta-lactamase superfamily II)
MRWGLTIVVLVLAVCAGAGYHYLFGYLVTYELNQRVTVLHRKNALRQIGANVVIYNSPNETVIVDSQLPALAQATLSAVEELTTGPISRAIITHWHPDHSGGISAFPDEVQVLAHANVVALLGTQHEGFGLTKPGSYHSFEARKIEGLPTQFDEEQLRSQANIKLMTVAHYPNAHTNGDLVVYFHDAEVAVVGDLIWPHAFPFVDVHNGGSVLGLEKALEAIVQRTGPNFRFVTGHGEKATSFSELAAYLVMVQSTRHWVEAQLDAGKTINEVRNLGLETQWENWSSNLVPSSTWIDMIDQSRVPNVN